MFGVEGRKDENKGTQTKDYETGARGGKDKEGEAALARKTNKQFLCRTVDQD